MQIFELPNRASDFVDTRATCTRTTLKYSVNIRHSNNTYYYIDNIKCAYCCCCIRLSTDRRGQQLAIAARRRTGGCSGGKENNKTLAILAQQYRLSRSTAIVSFSYTRPYMPLSLSLFHTQLYHSVVYILTLSLYVFSVQQLFFIRIPVGRHHHSFAASI